MYVVLRDAILSCLKQKLMSATWRDFASLQLAQITEIIASSSQALTPKTFKMQVLFK